MFVRSLLSAGIVFVCIFSTNAAESDNVKKSKNLVTNPSLEDSVGRSGLPPGWGSFYPNPVGSYKYEIVDGGRTGKKSIQIEGDGTFGAMPANRVEIDRSKRYVVRGWVKLEGDANATADVKFHYYEANGRYLGQTRVGYVSPTTSDWQFVTVVDRASAFPEAKLVGLAIAATGKAKAQYDDLELISFDKDKLPKDFEMKHGVTRSPQLALLGRRVGTWATETTIRPCVWFSEGSTSKGIETVRWVLGGQFTETNAKNLTTGVSSRSLVSFDRKSKTYRSWYFDSNGTFPQSKSVGTWDEATQTFTFVSSDDNMRSTTKLLLIGDDAAKWTGIWKNDEDQVLLDMTISVNRKTEQP